MLQGQGLRNLLQWQMRRVRQLQQIIGIALRKLKSGVVFHRKATPLFCKI
jgi:hypothetical protein